jgi:predicted TIM-barrel fold metal-dependent hydrolase
MDVVDSQVHLSQLGSLETALAAMAAVGVAALMFDEFSSVGEDGRFLPSEVLPNGVVRPTCPTAEAFASGDPQRFGVLRRVDHADPDLAAIARSLAEAPYASGLRAVALGAAEIEALATGGFDTVFRAAAEHNLPVVALSPGRPGLLRPYAERFPDVRLVVDHCGARRERAGPPEIVDEVLGLARLPNVLLKWTKGSFFFAKTPYPFPDVARLLRRAVEAWGAAPRLWGWGHNHHKAATWAEELFYVRDSADFSTSEKEWVLGRTARAAFGWPTTA